MDNDKVIELLEWLKGKKYLIDEDCCTMTEDFEQKNAWELSRNTFVNSTIKKVFELVK